MPVLTPQVDIANARTDFANGAVANITASRVSRERLRKLRIFQRSGYLSLDLAAGTGEYFRHARAISIRCSSPRAARARGVRRACADSTRRKAEPLVLELVAVPRRRRGAQAGRRDG